MEKEPEAYSIGWVPFINTQIHLDSRPLIPRTETEYWVTEEKALYGGKGGLEVISRILNQASNHLTPLGVLYLEHEPEQASHLAQHPLYQKSDKDQYGVLRFSQFTK